MRNHQKLSYGWKTLISSSLLPLFILLGGCGGGGDNPGACFGSDEVCGTGRSSTSGAAGLATGSGNTGTGTTGTGTTGNQNDLRNLTCASFSTPAAAQAALAAGATQLDSNGDGIACNPG